jgi:23S rRNA pseudouridine2605 synthase
MRQRLAKAIANGGICSRRRAEILIKEGLVSVDGKIVHLVSTIVEDCNKIEISGQLVHAIQAPRLWIYYKPIGLITTHKDPQNRCNIFDSLVGLPRVVSVGRLDINSEGLLLLTNSGAVARSFELPSNKIERVYKVRAYGNPILLISHWSSLLRNSVRTGISQRAIVIDGVIYNPKSIKLLKSHKNSELLKRQNTKSANHWFEVILTEGKNREIRKIFHHFNLQVNRLIRVAFGDFFLDSLRPGEYKEVINIHDRII